jgi:beta-phosphoglucomutase
MTTENHWHEDRRALILDFDGVVVDTERVHFVAWRAAFQEVLNVDIGEDHLQIVGLSLEQLFELWVDHGYFSADDQAAEFQERLLERKTELFFELGETLLVPMPGIVDLVRTAQRRGWYVAIASRARRLRLLRTLEVVGIPATFDLLMGSEDVVDAETDRKNHDRPARVFGIDPARCVVIEDSASGVSDARTSGIGCVIGLTTSFDAETLRAAGAHRVVDELGEIDLFGEPSA